MPEPLWTPVDASAPPAPPAPPAVHGPGAPSHTDGRRTADAALTTVLLALLLPLGFVATIIGVFSGMGIEGCGDDQSCRDVIGTMVAVVAISPTVMWLLAVVGSIVQLARRRPAWWVPLVPVIAWIGFFALLIGLAEALHPDPGAGG